MNEKPPHERPAPRGHGGLPPVIDWHRVALGGAVLAVWTGLILVLALGVFWS